MGAAPLQLAHAATGTQPRYDNPIKLQPAQSNPFLFYLLGEVFNDV
jgi:hypothetical protein